ncbi:MAG: hypothetical protein E2O96_04155 [Acidobacteria bacterium]|nr:MAG: hypothetical protein E2O96_04155 [Acidobacteriota bacterium]
MTDNSSMGSPSDRATLLIAAASGTLAFAIGFNYGAFKVIFFDQLLTVWVLATVVFIGSLVTKLPPNTWPRRLILLLPSLWVVAAAIDNTIDMNSGERFVFTLTVIVTLVALPFVAWSLVTAINADFAELPKRNKGIVLTAVAIFFVLGAVLGANNDSFLTCQDFKVSGNDLPANCLETSP